MAKFGIALDPGKHGCGLAVFDMTTNLLRHACYADGRGGPVLLASGRAVVKVYNPQDVVKAVIEYPQYYRDHIDPNNLIDLGIVGGYVAGSLPSDIPIEFVRPHAWIGNVPKQIMATRARKKLTPEEIEKIDLSCPETLHHNIWDAVAMGLRKLVGRM